MRRLKDVFLKGAIGQCERQADAERLTVIYAYILYLVIFGALYTLCSSYLKPKRPPTWKSRRHCLFDYSYKWVG